MQVDWTAYLWAVLPWIALAAIVTAIAWGILRHFPNASLPVFVLGLLGFCLFLFLSYQAVEWNTLSDDASYEAQRSRGRIEAATRIAERDHARLSGRGWVEGKEGQVTMPIEQAMQLQVAVLAKKKVAAANAINPVSAPAPASAPQPAPAPAEGAAAPAGGETPPAASEPAKTEPAATEPAPAMNMEGAS